MSGFATQKKNLNEIALDHINQRTRTIEIIGPPGIGKSTFYKSLCNTWNTSTNWIDQKRLLTQRKPKPTEFIDWLDYQLRSILNKNVPKDIPVDYGLRFVDHNKELALYFWDRLSGNLFYSDNEIDKCFRSAYFLFKDFCRYQAIFECTSSKPCIIDEGFLQKSFLIQGDEKFMRDVVNEYFPMLPLPHSVVYMNTRDVNIVVDRISNRKKINPFHFNKNKVELNANIEKWQQLFEIIIEKLRHNHIPVHYIDGVKTIEENVRYINSVLS